MFKNSTQTHTAFTVEVHVVIKDLFLESSLFEVSKYFRSIFQIVLRVLREREQLEDLSHKDEHWESSRQV